LSRTVLSHADTGTSELQHTPPRWHGHGGARTHTTITTNRKLSMQTNRKLSMQHGKSPHRPHA